MPKPGIRECVAVGRAIAAGNLLRHEGPLQLTSRFETRFAEHMGSQHALAMTSGTTALHAAMTAIGVGPGDEVLVPAYTWIATAAAPALAGAVPVLVDIDESLTMDPADLEKKITPHTKAIIPVHMANAPCDMDAIMEIARRHNLRVVEDACQAVGVSYKGRMCGSIGDIGVFSFNHFKNMNIGEGGAVVTNDAALFKRIMNFHDLGAWARPGYAEGGEPSFISGHARVTEIQGAMLDAQLSRLPGYIRGLTRSRAAVAGVLADKSDLRLSPHHDVDSAAGMTVIFETEREAIRYAERPGAYRLFDNSKHVYTNWKPILEKRSAHRDLNPWAWAHREISYDASTCARTLDILRRTCRIYLSERWPTPVARWKARALAAPSTEQTEAGGMTQPDGQTSVPAAAR